jgi:hypothetical protein
MILNAQHEGLHLLVLCLCFFSQPPALLLLMPQLLLQICHLALLCTYVVISFVQAVL